MTRTSICSLLTLIATLAGPALAQYDCSTATVVTIGTTTSMNFGATSSLPPWSCATAGSDVWFLFQAATSGPIYISTCGSDFDTVLEVFDGSGGCNSLLSLGCNDDSSCGLQSEVFASVNVGPCYIRVGGFNGQTGNVSLNVFFGIAATVVAQGSGCGNPAYASFYESFPTAQSFDLTGRSLSMINTGNGYAAVLGFDAITPVGPGATTLALTDDSQAAPGSLGLSVGSNCWISFGPGFPSTCCPSVLDLLNSNFAVFTTWRDLNPQAPGSGQVMYEENGSVATVTYDGVYTFGTSQPNYTQFVIDTITRDVTIIWGPQGATGGEILVGFSPDGPNLDPGSRDLSTSTIFGITTDTGPLELTAIGTPIQSSLATTFDVTTSQIPAGALLHVGILGLTSPGLPLGPTLGANGCFLHASVDLILSPLPMPGTAVTWTGMNLPALLPDFSGFRFYLQAAILGVSDNSALGVGLITSNGLECTVGTF